MKGEWNFDGFVVSDWNSIGELIGHGVAKNKEEAANSAISLAKFVKEKAKHKRDAEFWATQIIKLEEKNKA